MVKFSIIIATFFLVISCSDDFPPAPELKFCKLEELCESIHKFSESDCAEVGGIIVDSCEELPILLPAPLPPEVP